MLLEIDLLTLSMVVGTLPEPHFLRWDRSQTLIGTSHFHMEEGITFVCKFVGI